MNDLPWDAIGVITALVAALGTALAASATWFIKIGRTDRRLDDIEAGAERDRMAVQGEIKQLTDRVDKLGDRLDSRIDQLITVLFEQGAPRRSAGKASK